MSTFHWEGLHVRYNTRDGKPATGWSYDEDSVTVVGLLALRGFNQKDGLMTDCIFVRDESLPRGMMVVEPKPSSEPPTEEPLP